MLFVHVDADHRLIPRQMLLGKFCGNLQRLLRRDLPRLEGLDDVVILHTVLFAHGLLGVQHLAALPARVAVEVGGEDALLGLVPIEDVIDADVQAALPGQDFRDSDSHRLPSYKTRAASWQRQLFNKPLFHIELFAQVFKPDSFLFLHGLGEVVHAVVDYVGVLEQFLHGTVRCQLVVVMINGRADRLRLLG